jgi:hypothetical protein
MYRQLGLNPCSCSNSLATAYIVLNIGSPFLRRKLYDPNGILFRVLYFDTAKICIVWGGYFLIGELVYSADNYNGREFKEILFDFWCTCANGR